MHIDTKIHPLAVDPTFLFIGGARCASTWIHACLKDHPDVFVPERTKEVHFFNRNANWNRGLNWYRGFFKSYNGEHAIGEVTPSYLCHADSAKRIHRCFPRARLVINLRDPVERAWSSYHGYVLSGRVCAEEDIENVSRRLALDNQSSIIEHGFYLKHIERYLRFFSRDQMLILLYDDLITSPVDFVKEIYSFLRVDPNFCPSVLSRRINENFSTSSITGRAVRKLNRIGLRVKPLWPRAHMFYESALRRLRDQVVPRVNTKVPADIAGQLSDVYGEENERLAKFLGRDLSAWQ